MTNRNDGADKTLLAFKLLLWFIFLSVFFFLGDYPASNISVALVRSITISAVETTVLKHVAVRIAL
jgi:hypothetical protein